MILRVLLPLQLLGTSKHALAFHVFPGHMFRSLFNNNVRVLLRSPRAMLQPLQQLQQQQQQRTAQRTTARSGAGVARATDTAGTVEPSNACFLGNDGQWIDYEEMFKHSWRGNEFKGQDDSKYLRELTVTQLRQEARERGQTSTGTREVLVERLVSKQAPGETLNY